MVLVSRSLLLLAAATAAPPTFVTDAPVDAVQRCVTGALAANGKPTAINTASGVTLDFAFSNVGTDGRVRVSHLGFTIEDQGTQRRLSATATDPADDALAQQLMRDVARRCLPEGDAHPPG